MADKFIAEKLFEKAIDGVVAVGSWLKSEVSRVQSVGSELEKLNDTRKRIEALLSDAEQRRYIEDDSVILWLRNLKAVAFDAEDLDDEFKTGDNVDKNQGSRKRKRPTFTINRQFADRIEKIRERYEFINKDRKHLRFKKGETTRRVPNRKEPLPPQESSLQDELQVHGRDRERDEIVELLISGDSGGVLPVISIIGCGGLGKTTLARLIFQHERVKRYFSLRIWVGLSQGFDMMKTTEEIIRAIENKECQLSSLNQLQCHLMEIVREKRFLLVLDNVWNEELDFWGKLRVPLINEAEGSKVLITTRSERISRNMQTVHPFCLKSLPVEDCWLLFQDRVFARAEPSKILEEHPDLKKIGMKIVKKCQGSPLAAKSIGSLLYSVTDEDEWRCVLNDMPDIEEVKDNVKRILEVSYDHLPLHLKHCFAFCSIFPNGHEFDKDELVKLWMSVGFIKPSGRRRVEDIGGKYFDDLLWRSFFQASDSYQENRQKYKMPSVIHDLAQYVSEFECVRMDQAGVHGDIKTARYGLLNQCKMEPVAFEKIFENEFLRALILHGEKGVLTELVLCELFDKLRYLRVLDLSNNQVEELPDKIGGLILLRYLSLYCTKITTLPESVGDLYNLQTLELSQCRQLVELPDSIGDLKHLRHLCLYNTEIEKLPESVSRLCNLQTLELGECYKLQELPKDMSKLVSLRYLGLHLDWEVWNRKTDLISMPLGIGRLTSLQTLSRFVVGSQRGCGIGELRNLNLRGELCISKIENVVNVSDAEEANLKVKRYIDFMMLRWSDGACSSSQNGGHEEEVIERLRPHENLKQLWIDNYNGTRFPGWMADPSFLKLTTLRLSKCGGCRVLPFLGKLPQLKSLHIEGLHGVENMDHGDDVTGFPSLETLSLIDMTHLERFEVKGADMAHLSKLTIQRCSKLGELSCLPLALEKLEITDCLQLNWNTFPVVPNLRDLVVVGGGIGDTIKWIERLTSLSSLTLSQFSLLECVPNNLTSLRKLKIRECNELVSLAQNEGFQGLASLEYLEISSCPKLSLFPQQGLPATLKEFQFHCCESLTSLPLGLDLLSSLIRIEIQNVPGLKSIPALPAGLLSLTIKGCPTLQQRCQKDGADWYRICRIPCLDIDPISQSWFKKIVTALTPRIRSQ